jgi:hypothetical protein
MPSTTWAFPLSVPCQRLPAGRPLQRFKYPLRCPTARRRTAVASHEVGRSTECCEQRSCKRIGLPAPSLTSLFPESLSGFTSPPAPGLLRVRVHPPMSFTPPTEFQPPRTCLALACETPLLGFHSPSRHQQKESTCERASQAHPTVRPRRFSRPRRFAPLPALRVCFTPQPRPGFTFQGFSPATQPERLVGTPCPPVGWRLLPTAELPRQRQLHPPRLQGFDPGSDSKPPAK